MVVPYPTLLPSPTLLPGDGPTSDDVGLRSKWTGDRPSANQRRQLKLLAKELGRPVPDVSTRRQAARAIGKLNRVRASRDPVSSARAEAARRRALG